jgi:hypothetical protein
MLDLLLSMAMMVAGPPDLAGRPSEVGTRNAWTISSDVPPAAVAPIVDLPAGDLGAAAVTAPPSAAAAPALTTAFEGALTDPVAAEASAAAHPATLGRSANEVDDEVLGEQRGGFDIGGVNVTLGAEIQTSINGQLSLVTTVNWTDTTATTSQSVMGLLTPATAAQLQAGVLNTGHITMNVGGSSVFLANDGQTAVIHNTSDGIQSILVNTANNTTISTQVTATIGLEGYSGFQDTFKAATLGASLGEALGAATLAATGT